MMSSRHLGKYKGNLYMMDKVLRANVRPTEAPVTRMGLEIVRFSCHYVFRSIYFGLRIQMFAFS